MIILCDTIFIYQLNRTIISQNLKKVTFNVVYVHRTIRQCNFITKTVLQHGLKNVVAIYKIILID